MSSTVEDLAAKLADEVMDVMDEFGEDRLYMEVSKVIGSSSQTLEEAFLTEIRVRLSERAGRRFLKSKIEELRARAAAAESAPEATPDT